MKSKFLPIELLFFTTAILALYFTNINSSQYSLCPLKALKISFCPGCGLGHSLHFIMHGQFKPAWQAHPIGFFAFLVIIYRIFTLLRNASVTFAKKIIMQKYYFHDLPNITVEELTFLKDLTTDLSDEQQKTFVMIYNGKRRDPQHVLLFTILGFFGVAGIQRFLTNQIGMGILYFFTAGLCFIGTIVDLINYKSLANEFNQTMAKETLQFIQLSRE